jgi:hypothetical protein
MAGGPDCGEGHWQITATRNIKPDGDETDGDKG